MASPLAIEPYTPAHREAWDALVRRSKNGTFLFERGYMEYHADRFEDASLLFYEGGELLALLPANRVGAWLHSHGGLTYGGILCDERMTTERMLALWDALLAYLREKGEIAHFLYKTAPEFYHTLPAQEDRYALFRHGAQLIRRDIGSIVAPPLTPNSRRRRSLKRARQAGLLLEESRELAPFWEILAETLRERHEVAPVHRVEEMELLIERFPDAIRLITARDNSGALLAGSLLFLTPSVVHTQYLCNTAEGRSLGALDAVVEEVATRFGPGRRWMSFGISTEEAGRVLNEGLIIWKESFGARACVHDFYQLDI